MLWAKTKSKKILDTLEAAEKPLNAHEIAYRMNEQTHIVFGRLNELRGYGCVSRSKPKGFKAAVYTFVKHRELEETLHGRKIGKLTVLRIKGAKPTAWLCKCECGNKRTVVESRLLSDSITMCWSCERREEEFDTRAANIVTDYQNLISKSASWTGAKIWQEKGI